MSGELGALLRIVSVAPCVPETVGAKVMLIAQELCAATDEQLLVWV